MYWWRPFRPNTRRLSVRMKNLGLQFKRPGVFLIVWATNAKDSFSSPKITVRQKTMPRLSKFIIFLVSALLAMVTAQAAPPALAIGTYQKGNNVTEPRPQKSEYFETLHGGIVVVGDNAGYYLFAKVIKKPTKDSYIVVEYENPSGGKPFTNDMEFKTTAEELHFSAPEFVKGLKSYSDYGITVKVFESREAKEPIDVLKQTIRCYVDTSGPKAKMFNRLKGK